MAYSFFSSTSSQRQVIWGSESWKAAWESFLCCLLKEVWKAICLDLGSCSLAPSSLRLTCSWLVPSSSLLPRFIHPQRMDLRDILGTPSRDYSVPIGWCWNKNRSHGIPLKHPGLMNCLPQENRNSSLGQLRMKDFLVMGEFIIHMGQELIRLSCYSGLEAKDGGKVSQLPEQAVFLMWKSWAVPALFPAHTSARALSLSTEPIDSTDQFFQSQAARPMKNDFVAHHPTPPHPDTGSCKWNNSPLRNGF